MSFLPHQPTYDKQWRCEACDVELAMTKAKVTYMGAAFDIDLPCCPSCGQFFIDKALAEGKMREAEMLLEDK